VAEEARRERAVMAHPNEELLRKGYDAFGRGDMATVQSLFAEDIVWHFPGKGPLAGDHKGVGEVMAWFGRSAEMSGGTLRVEVHDIVANNDHGVALTGVTAEREGKRYADNSVAVYHVRDGKVVEVWNHPGDLYAADDFWS
jgi:ketosteroid isomerase-like protein